MGARLDGDERMDAVSSSGGEVECSNLVYYISYSTYINVLAWTNDTRHETSGQSFTIPMYVIYP